MLISNGMQFVFFFFFVASSWRSRQRWSINMWKNSYFPFMGSHFPYDAIQLIYLLQGEWFLLIIFLLQKHIFRDNKRTKYHGKMNTREPLFHVVPSGTKKNVEIFYVNNLTTRKEKKLSTKKKSLIYNSWCEQ